MSHFTDALIKAYSISTINLTENVNKADLTKSRMVVSDKIDSRGEPEASAVLMYTPDAATEPVLTRIAAYVFIVRETEAGFVFLAKRKKRRLPGGGFDKNTDQSLTDTVIRETLEEASVKIKDVVEVYNTWHPEMNIGFEKG